MKIEAVISLLKTKTVAAGGQKAWAKANGISAPYVGDVLHRRRDPGEKILSALGLHKVVQYAKKHN